MTKYNNQYSANSTEALKSANSTDLPSSPVGGAGQDEKSWPEPSEVPPNNTVNYNSQYSSGETKAGVQRAKI